MLNFLQKIVKMTSYQKIVPFLLLFVLDLVCADTGDVVGYVMFSIVGFIFAMIVIVICVLAIRGLLGYGVDCGGWETHAGKLFDSIVI